MHSVQRKPMDFISRLVLRLLSEGTTFWWLSKSYSALHRDNKSLSTGCPQLYSIDIGTIPHLQKGRHLCSSCWFFYYSSSPQASNVCELLCLSHSGHLWHRWKSIQCGCSKPHSTPCSTSSKQQRLHFIPPVSQSLPSMKATQSWQNQSLQQWPWGTHPTHISLHHRQIWVQAINFCVPENPVPQEESTLSSVQYTLAVLFLLVPLLLFYLYKTHVSGSGTFTEHFWAS